MNPDGSHELMYLYDLETHSCSQDRVGVLRQDFKNEVKRVMAQDPRAKFGKVNVFEEDYLSLMKILLVSHEKKFPFLWTYL